MKTQKILVFSTLALVMVLSACTSVISAEVMANKPTEVMKDKPTDDMVAKPTDDMMSKPTDDMMAKPTVDMMAKPTDDMMSKPTDDMMAKPTDDMMAKPGDGAMMDYPAWFSATLTDVNTGNTFTIIDFKGKVVLVETMAQWCPNCKKQQEQVKLLLEKLGMPDNLVTIALDIDPNEEGDMLKAYAANNGFGWIYAVAPADVSREIGNLYGDQFLNPPSTPILVIDSKGEAHPLPFGIKSAEDLMKAIEEYLKEGM
jgi:thiol-disulfide isomerase/thioredoxin